MEERRLLAAAPDGLFGEQNIIVIISTPPDASESVFAVDVDGDGDLDVLSASHNDSQIAWYENDGSEGFTAHTISTAADVASSVFAADMDGDGDIDVLSASRIDGKIAWYENLGSPFAADLTGNGFVDFEDLTVLLAAWTGPGPAGAPVGRRLAAAPIVEDEVRSDRIHAVGQDPMNRVTTSFQRRGKPAAYARNPLRRLQAAAVDRAMGDNANREERIFTRRHRRDQRSRLYELPEKLKNL